MGSGELEKEEGREGGKEEKRKGRKEEGISLRLLR